MDDAGAEPPAARQLVPTLDWLRQSGGTDATWGQDERLLPEALEIEDLSRSDAPATGSAAARLRLQIAHVVRNCRDVVRDILEASGASAHFLDNELQRIHRDIPMIAAHTIFDLDAAGEHLGHELLKPARR